MGNSGLGVLLTFAPQRARNGSEAAQRRTIHKS